MPYVDTQTIHNPATGTVAPATWGDQVRDNLEFLIDPPACQTFHSAAVTIPNNVATVHSADSEVFDNDAMHSTVTNNSRITIQTAGRYLINTRVTFNDNAVGVREIRVLKNAATLAVVYGGPPADGTVSRYAVGMTDPANVADYYEIAVVQTSGAPLFSTLAEFTAIFLTR